MSKLINQIRRESIMKKNVAANGLKLQKGEGRKRGYRIWTCIERALTVLLKSSVCRSTS